MISNDSKHKELLCPKCLQYPFFQDSFHQPGVITIDCHCGYHSTLLLQNYLQHLSNNNNVNINCSKHSHNPFCCFCINCNRHLCDVCYKENEHKEHRVIEIKNDINIEEIKDKKDKAHLYIDNYLKGLKNKIVNELYKQIKRTENAYEESISNNNNILLFIEMLINSYSKDNPNYYIQKNIINNTNIDFSKFSVDNDGFNIEEVDKIVNYFKYESIIKKGKKAEISYFKVIKSIKEHTFIVYSLHLLQDGHVLMIIQLKSTTKTTILIVLLIYPNFKMGK